MLKLILQKKSHIRRKMEKFGEFIYPQVVVYMTPEKGI